MRVRYLGLAVLVSLIVLVGRQCPATASGHGSASSDVPFGGLTTLDACQLEQLFANATATRVPVGFLSGRPLLFTTHVPAPRIALPIAQFSWKGKHFRPDGSFINQFRYRAKIEGQASLQPSWYDGKPCLVAAYPPHAPLFGNTRDELREVAPGLFLGRIYRLCPRRELLGYMCLQEHCSGNCMGLSGQ